MRHFFSRLWLRRQQPAKSGRSKPCIEHLEDRNVLSTVAVSMFADLRNDPAGLAVSLRDAVQFANQNSGDDTVSVPAGNYLLSIAGFGDNSGEVGDLDITDTSGSLILE